MTLLLRQLLPGEIDDQDRNKVCNGPLQLVDVDHLKQHIVHAMSKLS